MSRVRGQSTPKVRMVSNFFQICLSVNDYFYMYYVDIFAHPHNEHDAPNYSLIYKVVAPKYNWACSNI